MGSTIIRTKECAACGAHIAFNLLFCPYCDTEQPEGSRIPLEVYNRLMEMIKDMERVLRKYLYSRKTEFRSFLVSVFILFLPIIGALFVQYIFKDWILSGIFLACGVLISTIRIQSNRDYHIVGDVLEKKKWKRHFRRKFKRYLKRNNLDMSIYYEVILDYLEKIPYPDQSDLCVTLDELGK